jgi:hypothetical protein
MSQLAKQRLIILLLGFVAVVPLVVALAEGYGNRMTRGIVFALFAGLAVAAVISVVRGRGGRQ